MVRLEQGWKLDIGAMKRRAAASNGETLRNGNPVHISPREPLSLDFTRLEV